MMLVLPANWTTATGGHLTKCLLEQAAGRERASAVARCLIWAAFDLGFRAKWALSAPHLTVIEDPPFTWRIGDFTYRYLLDVNDELLSAITTSPPPAASRLLTPPRYQFLLRDALELRLADRAPTVMGIDDFLDLRLLFSSIDARWSHEQALQEFVRGYNDRVRTLGLASDVILDDESPVAGRPSRIVRGC